MKLEGSPVPDLLDAQCPATLARTSSVVIRSLLCGPYSLCGDATMVLPSSMKGLNSGMKSAPELRSPSSVRAPLRPKRPSLC